MTAHRCVIFDTEYTAWEGSRERRWSEAWEHREIIQIGAIVVELAETGPIECAALELVVRPRINAQLSPYICALTGLDQKRIDAEGMDITEAMQRLLSFADDGQLHCYSWGNDLDVITENYALYELPDLDLQHLLHDLMPFFAQMQPDVRHLESGRVGEAVGHPVQGQQHDALHDVRSLLGGLQALQVQGLLQSANWHPSVDMERS